LELNILKTNHKFLYRPEAHLIMINLISFLDYIDFVNVKSTQSIYSINRQSIYIP